MAALFRFSPALPFALDACGICCNPPRMGLIDRDKIGALLACPRCRAPLGGSYACTGCGSAFPDLGGFPVLVDFENSILDEAGTVRSNGESLIVRTRRRGLGGALSQMLTRQNDVAARNAARLQALLADRSAPVLLVIGGGSRGLGTEALYDDEGISIIAFDIYRTDNVQFIADGHRIPLRDASVDAVWIQAVLEHVLDPREVVAEIHRVLKSDGIVYAETPFMQQVHEGAFDFTRFTRSGHRWLFRNFEEIDAGVVLGAGTQFVWAVEHLVRGLTRSVRAGAVARLAVALAGHLDRVIPERFSADAASAVYFLGRRSDRAISAREMVPYYVGGHRRR